MIIGIILSNGDGYEVYNRKAGSRLNVWTWASSQSSPNNEHDEYNGHSHSL